MTGPRDTERRPDEPRPAPAEPPAGTGPRRPFLSIWFRCCHAYGRIYRNRDATAYEGRCPRCGRSVQALIGPDGTSQRIFWSAS